MKGYFTLHTLKQWAHDVVIRQGVYSKKNQKDKAEKYFRDPIQAGINGDITRDWSSKKENPEISKEFNYNN